MPSPLQGIPNFFRGQQASEISADDLNAWLDAVKRLFLTPTASGADISISSAGFHIAVHDQTPKLFKAVADESSGTIDVKLVASDDTTDGETFTFDTI